MSFELGELLITALTNTISGLVTNIVYILLFVWAVRFLAKEIKELGKNIPEWIATYFKYQNQQTKLLYALEDRPKK